MSTVNEVMHELFSVGTTTPITESQDNVEAGTTRRSTYTFTPSTSWVTLSTPSTYWGQEAATVADAPHTMVSNAPILTIVAVS